MAVSRSMRRLLHIREMEEELSQAALEAALNELRRLQAVLAAARERERGGRRIVAASARTGEVTDRIAGLEEIKAGQSHAVALKPLAAEAELAVDSRRQEFGAKRTERRQVETLIRKIEAGDAAEAVRRAQKDVDNWFLDKTRRGAGSGKEND